MLNKSKLPKISHAIYERSWTTKEIIFAGNFILSCILVPLFLFLLNILPNNTLVLSIFFGIYIFSFGVVYFYHRPNTIGMADQLQGTHYNPNTFIQL